MQNIQVHRYSNEETRKAWQGWIEPDDRSWIIFADADGHVTLFENRDSRSGAVLPKGATADAEYQQGEVAEVGESMGDDIAPPGSRDAPIG